MKTCIDCGISFPKTKDFFYHNGKSYLSRCKDCHYVYAKEKLWESRERDKLRRQYEK